MRNKKNPRATNIDTSKAIRNGLKRKGINQVQASEILGVTKYCFHKWATGKSIPPGDFVVLMIDLGIIDTKEAKKNPCEDRKS